MQLVNMIRGVLLMRMVNKGDSSADGEFTKGVLQMRMVNKGIASEVGEYNKGVFANVDDEKGSLECRW